MTQLIAQLEACVDALVFEVKVARAAVPRDPVLIDKLLDAAEAACDVRDMLFREYLVTWEKTLDKREALHRGPD